MIYRNRTTISDLDYSVGENMKIAVTGATGFLGSKVCSELASAGYEIVKLQRSKKRRVEDRSVYFDLDASEKLDSLELCDVDVVCIWQLAYTMTRRN